MNMDKIGQFLAALRKSRGLTQQEVADSLGVSDKTVSKWECGNGLPDISAIPAIAELFDVTSDEILRGERIIGERQAERDNKKTEEQLKYQVAVLYQKTKFQCIIMYISTAFVFLTSLYWLSYYEIKILHVFFLIPTIVALPIWFSYSDAVNRFKKSNVLQQHKISLKPFNRMTILLSIALFMLVYVATFNIVPVLTKIISESNQDHLILHCISLAVSLIFTLIYLLKNNKRE